MENDFGPDKYREFMHVFGKYVNDGDYASYKETLFRIFNDARWNYHLKGMILFTKENHKADFAKDVEKLICKEN